MNTKHWLIAGGIVVFLAIAGFIFGLYYVTRVTIKEISGESYLPAIFNQPLRTKTDMVMIELPPHNFIKEPLNIREEFHPSDPIMLEIPVGTPLMFTKAYIQQIQRSCRQHFLRICRYHRGQWKVLSCRMDLGQRRK